MGFDSPGSTQLWKIVVSDTQAYRQFGNAVAAPVSTAVAKAMAPFIHQALATHRTRKSIA
jgi:DNA (cytosine-5)-methyltransferase 1